MTTLLLATAFLVPAAGLGFAAGCWLCASGSRVPRAFRPECEGGPNSQLAIAESVIVRVQQLTEKMAADVGRHNVRVHQINAELRSRTGNINVSALVEQLIEANEVMRIQLNTAEERLQAQSSEIREHFQEARTDPLTELGNRRAFDEAMQQCVARLHDGGPSTCVGILDLDHFKRVNDQFGHPKGDEVLRAVAKVLRGTLAENATVFRYGGEEFSMLFPGMDLEEAKALLERARSAISGEVFQGNEHRLRVTATSGVACLENHELAGDVIYRADEALYAGKREGRDSGYWHDGQKVRPMFGAPRAMSDLASDCRTPSGPTEEEDDTDCPADSSQRCLDRESFLSVVGRLTSQWMKGGAPLAVVLVELSRAPTTPAVCRPEETDAAKRYLLDVIRHSIRGSDVFTQIDQSVFAILLPESGSPRAGMVAQRIQRLVNRPFTRNQREVTDVRVNTSIADIASGCKGDDLVARALRSLARAGPSITALP